MYVPTIQMLVPGACVVDLDAIFGFILVSGLWIEVPVWLRRVLDGCLICIMPPTVLTTSKYVCRYVRT